MTNEEILAQVRGYCLREGLLTPGVPLRLAAAVSAELPPCFYRNS